MKKNKFKKSLKKALKNGNLGDIFKLLETDITNRYSNNNTDVISNNEYVDITKKSNLGPEDVVIKYEFDPVLNVWFTSDKTIISKFKFNGNLKCIGVTKEGQCIVQDQFGATGIFDDGTPNKNSYQEGVIQEKVLSLIKQCIENKKKKDENINRTDDEKMEDLKNYLTKLFGSTNPV